MGEKLTEAQRQELIAVDQRERDQVALAPCPRSLWFALADARQRQVLEEREA
jgi:hypothetical protein